MLKCCVRPLVTLVLALVVTGVLSTLCAARDLRSPDGQSAVRTTDSAKPRPIVTSGEPDQPLAPPPARLNGGIVVPVAPDGDDDGGDLVMFFRWISGIWANRFTRTAF